MAVPAQAQTFGCNPPQANPIVCENSKPGTPASVWQIPWQMGDAGDPTIQGFATDISVDHGQTVSFKIKTDAASYRLDIYRMGYYGGNGARLITTINPSVPLPQAQPACITDPATKLYDCGNWGVSASWAVPADAVSGIYFAKATRSDTGGFSHIVFIVRDDESHSKILFQTSDETWQAYNSYGGNSLYGSDASNWDITLRAYKVSYNRPFNTNHISAATWIFNAEYPMVRWLEANGYDVSYFTHVDGARSPALLLDHKIFLAAGHDEYWSGPLRTNVEAARDAGVNLAFFTGNETFWKTRWETSIDGSSAPYRTLVCYKETLTNAQLDPMAPVWTGTWRDPRFSPPADGGRPENALTGTIFAVNGAAPDNDGLSIQVPADDGRMRFWRNTSLAHLSAGQTATLPRGTLGYEWDVADDNGFRPAGLIQLSTTTQQLTGSLLLDYGGTYGGGLATHHLTLYRAPSGALVFGAGSVQWSWGLENHNNPFAADFAAPPPSTDMRQATVNLLADMGVQPANIQPGLIPATQSTDTVAPVSFITSPTATSSLNRGVPVFITGIASDAGGGVVGGVEVSLDGGQTWHPAVGRENWAYAFTPTMPGILALQSRAIDDSGNIETPGPGLSVAIATNYSISGTILPPSAGGGTTVTLGGDAPQATVIADDSGNYSFSGLSAGNYTVTPSKAGFNFGPTSQAVSVSSSSVSGVNFGAGQSSDPTHSISGAITPLSYGTAVTITLTGATGASTITDSSGAFDFSGVPDGAYTLTPSRPNIVFSPTQISVSLSGTNVTGIAFNAAPAGETLFTTQTPTKRGQSDGPSSNYELGTQFQSDTAGIITAIRFWKDAQESGTHTGRIWSSTGELLASVDFTNETAFGWQQQTLDEPLLIGAATPYVVTVNTGNTFYVATNNELADQIVNGNLSSVVGDNGLFGAPGQFPTNSFLDTNYYRDVVFVPSANDALWYIWTNMTNFVGGTSLVAWVGLTEPAPPGGAVVTLWSDNPAVTVPASVTVSAGSDYAVFTIQTSGVSVDTTVNVAAIYNAWQSTVLTVEPAALTTISLNPNNVVGGTSATGIVTFNGPAPPSGASVALLSDSPAVMVPSSVTVPGGASSAVFTVTTSGVSTLTPTTIWASYYGMQSAALTITPAVLSSVSVSPGDLAGGTSSIGTVTLSGAAPSSGAVVTLSSNDPVVSGVVGVHSLTGLPQGGSIDWANLGPIYSTIASGTVTPVTGLPGLNVTLTTGTGLPMDTVTNCNWGESCGWYGNFAPGASVLWMSGTYYGDTGWWAPNGPLTLQFDTPQRGIGFQAMADENGAFTATLCAYNAAGTLLGCVPFNGNATSTADGSAAFMGLYDDAQEISKVTIDAGGILYPHDFAIGPLFVTNTRQPMVPASITVPAGAATATFPVNTIAAGNATTVTISGNYQTTQTATLTIHPPVLAAMSLGSETVSAGDSTTGVATLTGPAPPGGVVVTLSSDDSANPGVQPASSATDLSHDASVVWTDSGPSFTSIDADTSIPVTGEPGVSLNAATARGLSTMILTNCPAAANCGWGGNFVPAAPLLWVTGNYGDTGAWTGNGPLALAFSSPQRGVGFNIMPDESGSFTATVCAYGAGDQLLKCIPFSGDVNFQYANGTATYVGVYDDVPEITKVTIDTSSTLYPHDFAIGTLTLSTQRRTVPASVTVPAGAATASFPVNTNAVGAPTTLTISGAYGANRAAQLTVDP